MYYGGHAFGNRSFGLQSPFQLTDSLLTDADTLYSDALSLHFVVSDQALADGDTLYSDTFYFIISDPSLTNTSTIRVDNVNKTVAVSPYWRWRFVRQGGNLFLVPAKSFQAWKPDADIVSADFRFNTEVWDYAMEQVASAWASHSGSSTATLKAAIDAALSTAGFKDPGGTAL